MKISSPLVVLHRVKRDADQCVCVCVNTRMYWPSERSRRRVRSLLYTRTHRHWFIYCAAFMRRQVLAVVILHDGRMSASERTSERASERAGKQANITSYHICTLSTHSLVKCQGQKMDEGRIDAVWTERHLHRREFAFEEERRTDVGENFKHRSE